MPNCAKGKRRYFCRDVSNEIQIATLFLLMRVNLLQSWRKLLDTRRQSRLLTGLIGSFLAAYLVLSFVMFHHGLLFMAKFPGLGALLTERLMFVLFAFLFALLLLSNLIISYTNLFRNRETAFLLTLPVSTKRFSAGNSLSPRFSRRGRLCF